MNQLREPAISPEMAEAIERSVAALRAVAESFPAKRYRLKPAFPKPTDTAEKEVGDGDDEG